MVGTFEMAMNANPNPGPIHAIDEVICRSVKDRTSPEEERRLFDWRTAARANEEYYGQMLRLLETISAVAEPAGQHIPAAVDIIALADEAAPFPIQTRAGKGRRRGFTLGLAVAAAVLLAFGGLFYVQRIDEPAFSMGAGEYTSGPNETTTATLADGTIVRLAPNSRLRILDAPGRREVFLSGHAYLAVAPMPERPFLVHTPFAVVSVLGTRFDLRATDELRLVVVEGTVELSAERRRIEVAAGEMSMVSNDEVFEPVKVDVRPLVAWVGRFIAFQGTPLRDVALELEREYDARVVLADSSLAELTITGAYIDRNFEEVMVLVCGVLGARCSVQDGIATIGT